MALLLRALPPSANCHTARLVHAHMCLVAERRAVVVLRVFFVMFDHAQLDSHPLPTLSLSLTSPKTDGWLNKLQKELTFRH